MRNKKVLAIVLLSLSFCFVSGAGYGYISKLNLELKASRMDFDLLKARIDYIMKNPTNFLDTHLYYDPLGFGGETFPYDIETKDKIIILVYDNRDIFSDKSEAALLDQFEKELKIIYKSMRIMASNMNTDIVVSFRTREDISLGYFYQGEYHLWKE